MNKLDYTVRELVVNNMVDAIQEIQDVLGSFSMEQFNKFCIRKNREIRSVNEWIKILNRRLPKNLLAKLFHTLIKEEREVTAWEIFDGIKYFPNWESAFEKMSGGLDEKYPVAFIQYSFMEYVKNNYTIAENMDGIILF